MVKDLMNLRDLSVSYTLKDALEVSERIRIKSAYLNAKFSTKSNKSTSDGYKSISYDNFLLAVHSGAFEDEGFSQHILALLAGSMNVRSATSTCCMFPHAMLQRHPSIEEALIVAEKESALRLAVSKGISGSGLESDSARENNLDLKMECETCIEEFPAEMIYGGLLPCQKSCSCNIRMCILCLRSSIRVQVQDNVKPTCPGRLSDNERCTEALDSTLVSLLFKSECPLCSAKFDSSKVQAVNVGCALNHSFCKPCLQSKANDQMSNGQMKVPSCPRYSECKFLYDEAALRAIFEGSSDIDQKLIRWHNIKVQSAQDQHPLYKHCPAPDCKGFLSVTVRTDRSGMAAKTHCSVCLQTYCWSCLSSFHPGRTCADMSNINSRWVQFLSSQTGANAAIRLQQLEADNEYFRSNIAAGRIKRCPNCNRIIEKMEGCDTMVCGRNADGGNFQSGCNHKFQWSSVPNLTLNDESLQNERLNSDESFYISEPHVDYSVKPYKQLSCTECKKGIMGTRFECVFCPSKDSMCLLCIQQVIKSGSQSSHVNHVFELINPPKRPFLQYTRDIFIDYVKAVVSGGASTPTRPDNPRPAPAPARVPTRTPGFYRNIHLMHIVLIALLAIGIIYLDVGSITLRLFQSLLTFVVNTCWFIINIFSIFSLLWSIVSFVFWLILKVFYYIFLYLPYLILRMLFI
jgi:hypothetical protein